MNTDCIVNIFYSLAWFPEPVVSSSLSLPVSIDFDNGLGNLAAANGAKNWHLSRGASRHDTGPSEGHTTGKGMYKGNSILALCF